MKIFHSMFLVVSVLLLGNPLLASDVSNAPVAPGRYVSVGDWGTLVVKKGGDGKTRFEIESIGGNCHVCSLSGVLKGQTGIADYDFPPDGLEKCRVRLQPAGSGVNVAPITGEACRYFCGMRAGFKGLYKLPPASCASKQQQVRRAEFLSLYRAKKFAKAKDVLSGLLTECADFIDWIEIDKVRNDLALAQYHAGDAAACLGTLAETRAGMAKDEADLGLPPCDHDNYIGTAKATWHNQKLCGK
jgi:hypothetical protein